MKLKPQFKARVTLTFEELPPSRQRVFGFDDIGYRLVPMKMEGVDGLHAMRLWIGRAEQFSEGQEFAAECRVLWTEGFIDVVKAGLKFKLWDGGFFADGIVTERVNEGWGSR